MLAGFSDSFPRRGNGSFYFFFFFDNLCDHLQEDLYQHFMCVFSNPQHKHSKYPYIYSIDKAPDVQKA